ncbi:MAG TPA: hypothetical protein VF590_01045, partial [Isosphaeraceae bacterium]
FPIHFQNVLQRRPEAIYQFFPRPALAVHSTKLLDPTDPPGAIAPDHGCKPSVRHDSSHHHPVGILLAIAEDLIATPLRHDLQILANRSSNIVQGFLLGRPLRIAAG